MAVLPLQHEIDDASNRAAAAEVHAAFLKLLPSIPNLALVGPDTPADFTMTITGKAPTPNQPGFPLSPPPGPNAAIMARIMSPAGQYHVQVKVDAATQRKGEMGYKTVVLGPLPDLCQVTNGPTPWQCVTPTSRVQATMEDLRLRVFPPDFALQRESLAQFRNTSLTPLERSLALNKLSSLGREQRSGFWEEDWQPADLAAAMELAKSHRPNLSDDGTLRTLLLNAMDNVKNPDFVRPLIEILQQDTSEEVRLEAARILARNFAGNSTARSALEAASRTDSSEPLRQVAQRALLGDKGWHDHIVATLNDSRQGAIARVAPLVLGERTSFGGPTPTSQVTLQAASSADLVPDDRMILGVVSMFPSLMADPEWLEVSGSIMRILERSNHPAVKDAMLQALGDERDQSIAASAASYLLRRYGDSPDVRRQVEESAATRGLVREILDESPRAPSK